MEQKRRIDDALRSHCNFGMSIADNSNPSQSPLRPCKRGLGALLRSLPLKILVRARYVMSSMPLVIPGSSGYKLRSYGIVGSTNGRGVCSSKNMGRLIATFDPRLDLMFAVNVLRKRSHECNVSTAYSPRLRKTCMRIRNFLW